jgi:hypothetical protein
MKNTPQARYKRAKVNTRRVDFYPADAKILSFSREINFAAFVKEKLEEAMKEKSDEKKN